MQAAWVEDGVDDLDVADRLADELRVDGDVARSRRHRDRRARRPRPGLACRRRLAARGRRAVRALAPRLGSRRAPADIGECSVRLASRSRPHRRQLRRRCRGGRRDRRAPAAPGRVALQRRMGGRDRNCRGHRRSHRAPARRLDGRPPAADAGARARARELGRPHDRERGGRRVLDVLPDPRGARRGDAHRQSAGIEPARRFLSTGRPRPSVRVPARRVRRRNRCRDRDRWCRRRRARLASGVPGDGDPGADRRGAVLAPARARARCARRR